MANRPLASSEFNFLHICSTLTWPTSPLSALHIAHGPAGIGHAKDAGVPRRLKSCLLRSERLIVPRVTAVIRPVEAKVHHAAEQDDLDPSGQWHLRNAPNSLEMPSRLTGNLISDLAQSCQAIGHVRELDVLRRPHTRSTRMNPSPRRFKTRRFKTPKQGLEPGREVAREAEVLREDDSALRLCLLS